MSANGGPAVRAMRSSARSMGEDAREIWCDISRACVYASVVVVVVVVVVHAVRAWFIFRRGGATRGAVVVLAARDATTHDGGGGEARRRARRARARSTYLNNQRDDACSDVARARAGDPSCGPRHSARAHTHDTIIGVRPHGIRTRRARVRVTRDVKNHIATS